jgi:hypothetical protein
MFRDILFQLSYSHDLPNKLCGLVDDDPGERAAAAKFVSLCFNAVTECELCGLGDLWLQEYCKNLLWPENSWVREVCLAVEEMGEGHCLPSDMYREVYDYSLGFGTTKVNEDLFNHLRKVEKASPGGRLGGRAIWHASINSSILPENDLPRLQASHDDKTTAKLAGRVFTQSDFDARTKGLFSLGEEKFIALKDHGPEWPTPSAERYVLRPLALRSLISFRGNFLKLKSQFYSLLATPGDLLLDRGDPVTTRGALVLQTTEFGAITWRCNLKLCNGLRVVLPFNYTDESEPWQQWQICDCSEVFTIPVRAMPPTVARRELQLDHTSETRCRGVVLVLPKNTKPELLLRSAARTAFRRFTCSQMLALIADAAVPYTGPRPTRERDIAELLVRWQLPDSTDEEVEQYLNHRALRPPVGHSSVLCADNLGALEGLLHDDEFKDVADAVHKTVPKPTTKVGPASSSACAASSASAPTGPAAASSGSGAASSSTAIPIVLRPISPADYTVPEARDFMPFAIGAWLGINSQKNCWQVKYPMKVDFPKSHTETWGVGGTSPTYLTCLANCLQWVWVEHTRATGSVCPYDWS